jgi:RimJ/RimL family protein N-acetyltransferase
MFLSYAQDPQVCRFMTWCPAADIEAARAHVRAAIVAADRRIYALVCARQGEVGAKGALLGTLELRRLAPFKLEFGYVLARAAWGRGLMTEALTATVAWALGQPDIWRIGGVCDVENQASARVMEKSGLVREGVLRRWILHPNLSADPRDCFSYARIR